ncbi:hypothetical protein [Symmachiella dynata]|uniref:hypothetical protein n=1 Tax=Symmachiella dynata TaxID=2527995 RepID=UPI0030EDB0EA
MDHNSSTSNSNWRPEAWLLALFLTAVAAYWAFDWLGGGFVAEQVADRFGTMLIEKSRGRITQPAEFIAIRMREGLWFIAMAVGMIGVALLAARIVRRWCTPLWAWLPLSLIAFATVNGVIGAAGETGTYWMVLFAGSGDSKQPEFQIARILHRDSDAKEKVVILGSSQGLSEIDEPTLNRRFAPQKYFANLSYVGSHTIEFLLTEPWYGDEPPEVAICYLSELNFYTKVSGARLLPLLKVSAWPTLQELEIDRFDIGNRGINGYVASVLPAFQSRRSLEYFLFGTPAVENKIKRVQPSLKPDAESAARTKQQRDEAHAKTITRMAKTYAVNDDTEFHKTALEMFLQRAQQTGTQVVLIFGQVNPVLSQQIDPTVRRDFLDYKEILKKRFPDVLILSDELPVHPESDYHDMMHLNEEAQIRYTQSLADVLQDRLGWSPGSD